MARKSSFESEEEQDEHPKHPEIRGLLLLACTLLITLSLLSFTDGNASDNWFGLLGYTLAWLLQYSFGLGSYCIILYLGWMGWRLLCNKSVEHLGMKAVYFLMALGSFCILLNLCAETQPKVASFFGKYVYSETIRLETTLPYRDIRHNLGGVPFYFIYRDLPLVNFQQVLSNVGTGIVFSISLLTSLLLLTRIRLLSSFENIKNYFAERRHRPNTDIEQSSWIERLKDRFHMWRLKEAEADPAVKPRIEKAKTPKPAAKSPAKSSSKAGPSEKKESGDKASTPSTPEKQTSIIEDLKNYVLPGLSFLTPSKKNDRSALKKDLRKQAEILEETLLSFGIEAKVENIHCGPTIASFEVQPAVGVKVQKIKALESDIALNLKAKSIRILTPIPGKAVVGVEIPSPQPQEVSFREMLSRYQKGSNKCQIPVILGKTVSGEDVISDLTKMPHCIIAGATGSGKSVCINTIVMSILMNARPDEVKLLMIDPKKVELTPYTALPHMLAPVITEADEAVTALRWLVREMEYRYEMLKHVGARNISGFNSREIDHDHEASIKESTGITIPEKLYYIVAIIDELADLMMVASGDIEAPIARIAQMARAVGIHLILATQRPSREVITGLIKANFPTRISFKVASRINSQIILDETGADTLLGNGDMLFLPPGTSNLTRAQGAFIRDADINRTIQHIRNQANTNYVIKAFADMEMDDPGAKAATAAPGKKDGDSLYDQALALVIETGNTSTTFLQRKLKIGYARAASLMDELEEQGVISPPDGNKPRKLLLNPHQSEE